MYRNKKIRFMLAIVMLATSVFIPHTGADAANLSINVTIDTTQGKTSISPLIYGGNWDFSDAKITGKRIGGNRMTGYNWENNFSSAGSDWQHSSDTYMLNDVPKDKWTQPASTITTFHDLNISEGIPYSLVTLQAAGFVSADSKGTVSTAEAAPSTRWKEVKFKKDSALSLTPDTTDDYVYMDEFVNFLVDRYGNASTSKGIKAYALDNEPALWPSTHPRIHPNQPQCSEVLNKNIELSKVIKGIDPYAEVYGPVLYGFAAYNDFQSAPDWKTVKGSYRWFLDYYLDNMKKASTTAGKRLLDVLDLHWYPEAQGGGVRITTNDTGNLDCNKARLQAPRTLWDKTYKETSWIQQWCSDFLPLLPNIKTSIDSYYPGTKLAFTEYSYGADDHITGGIAQADVLGVYGKYGVYAANIWGGGTYTASGFNLYTNYDGKGSKYGDTAVKCDTSDVENSSAYASIVGSSDNKLHIIVLNKSYDSPATFSFSINSSSSYKTGSVWGFDSTGSAISQKQAVTSISANKFSYTLPALCAYHIVLDSSGEVLPTPAPTSTLNVTPTATPSISYSGYICPDVSSNSPAIRSGFKVEVGGTNASTLTDEDGYFRIDGALPLTSSFILRVSKPGYLERRILSLKYPIGSKESPVLMWPGDLPVSGEQDRVINMSDIMVIANGFNTVAGDARFNAVADFNLDNAINMSDIIAAAKHFNTTTSSYPAL